MMNDRLCTKSSSVNIYIIRSGSQRRSEISDAVDDDDVEFECGSAFFRQSPLASVGSFIGP